MIMFVTSPSTFWSFCCWPQLGMMLCCCPAPRNHAEAQSLPALGAGFSDLWWYPTRECLADLPWCLVEGRCSDAAATARRGEVWRGGSLWAADDVVCCKSDNMVLYIFWV